MKKHLFVGGRVAVGFDPSARFLLTVSHSGRGVFEVGSWQRVARDPALAYQKDGHATGIGPIEGLVISIKELNYETGQLHFTSPDGKYNFEYEDGTITINESAAQQGTPADIHASRGRV